MNLKKIFLILVSTLFIASLGSDGICLASFDEARSKMVEQQLISRDIDAPKVLKVMGEIPREKFVPPYLTYEAYGDHPLPIGYGQTISQPYIVALMTQELGLKSTDRVLEIGTGSGYQAAVLSKIAKEVYTIEIVGALANDAKKRLSNLGYSNVHVKSADGYFGWKDRAPFDAIIVTAAAGFVPPPLMKQLKKGGRIIIPLGSTKYYQVLTLVNKGEDGVKTKHIANVRFVPMTGKVMSKPSTP